MPSGYTAAASSGADHARQAKAMLIRDQQSCIPLSRRLVDGDLVLLLTPVVVPNDSCQDLSKDPFEPLGMALARHHPRIRHVPYTARGGITNTHAGFIKQAKAVVFVISGPSPSTQSSQVELSEIVGALGEHRPQIIIACCNLQDLGPKADSFVTIVQLDGFPLHEQEMAADLLFDDSRVLLPGSLSMQNAGPVPRTWSLEPWNRQHDMPAVYDLWCECMPAQFHLDRSILYSLLTRDGYASNWVVRDPRTKEVLGFVGTYITYLNSQIEDDLVGSLAALLVRPSHRGQGIGLSLHNRSLQLLKMQTRGISRFQLGSTFPRLLYGLPVGLSSEDWFKRRGWKMDCERPGTGQVACDWVLSFENWPEQVLATPGLKFRPCNGADFEKVLALVAQQSERNGHMSWYDCYAQMADSYDMQDIIIGLLGDRIVATALKYIPSLNDDTSANIPWAAKISRDVGGLTCICITDDGTDMHRTRESIMNRLLDNCIRSFRDQGMHKMFLDAIKDNNQFMQSMNFQKWASYRECWRDAESIPAAGL